MFQFQYFDLPYKFKAFFKPLIQIQSLQVLQRLKSFSKYFPDVWFKSKSVMESF